MLSYHIHEQKYRENKNHSQVYYDCCLETKIHSHHYRKAQFSW